MRHLLKTACVLSAGCDDHLRVAPGLDVDEVVLDLTSAPPGVRDDFLRLRVALAIGSTRWRARTVSVQIAEPGTTLFDEDIIQLVMFLGGRLDNLVVPAVTKAEDVLGAGELLDEIESEFPVLRRLSLEARIGGGVRLDRLEEIVVASPRLVAVVLDPGAATRAMVSLVRAAGLTAMLGLPTENMLRAEAADDRLARSLGCGGRWALWPPDRR